MSSLVHALRMQAAMRAEPRGLKLRQCPRPRWPHGARLEYYAALLAIVKTVERIVVRDLLPKLPAILDSHAVARPEAEPVRHDATGGDIDDAFEALTGEVAAAIPERHIEMVAQSNALRVSAFNGKELQKQIQHVARLNLFDDSPALAAHLDVCVADNVALIKGPRRQARRGHARHRAARRAAGPAS